MGDTTTVQVENQTWKRLNALREPGETFDDIISKALDEFEQSRDDSD